MIELNTNTLCCLSIPSRFKAFFKALILASLTFNWFWFSSCCHLICSSNSTIFCWDFFNSVERLSTKSLFKSDSSWRPTTIDLNSASVSAEAVWWAKANCKSRGKREIASSCQLANNELENKRLLPRVLNDPQILLFFRMGWFVFLYYNRQKGRYLCKKVFHFN